MRAVSFALTEPAERVRKGHPFDLTKTRLQTAAPGVYTGAVDVVKKTLARDGITGYVVLALWKVGLGLMGGLQPLSWYGPAIAWCNTDICCVFLGTNRFELTPTLPPNRLSVH